MIQYIFTRIKFDRGRDPSGCKAKGPFSMNPYRVLYENIFTNLYENICTKIFSDRERNFVQSIFPETALNVIVNHCKFISSQNLKNVLLE